MLEPPQQLKRASSASRDLRPTPLFKLITKRAYGPFVSRVCRERTRGHRAYCIRVRNSTSSCVARFTQAAGKSSNGFPSRSRHELLNSITCRPLTNKQSPVNSCDCDYHRHCCYCWLTLLLLLLLLWLSLIIISIISRDKYQHARPTQFLLIRNAKCAQSSVTCYAKITNNMEYSEKRGTYGRRI